MALFPIFALTQLSGSPNPLSQTSTHRYRRVYNCVCLATQLFLFTLLPRYNAYSYLGTDAPDVVDSGRSQDNTFRENNLIGSLESIKLLDADGTQFIDNIFEDATTIRFNDARKTLMSGNVGLDKTKLKVANGATFDARSDDGFEPIE